MTCIKVLANGPAGPMCEIDATTDWNISDVKSAILRETGKQLQAGQIMKIVIGSRQVHNSCVLSSCFNDLAADREEEILEMNVLALIVQESPWVTHIREARFNSPQALQESGSAVRSDKDAMTIPTMTITIMTMTTMPTKTLTITTMTTTRMTITTMTIL